MPLGFIMRLQCTFWVFFYLVTATITQAAPLGHWEWRSSTLQGKNLSSIAFGNGRLLAVGEGNVQVTSTNGSHWETYAPMQDGDSSVAFGNGVFVVARGTWPPSVRVSSNGLDWTER